MVLTIEMNGKEKEMVHYKKWTFTWFLKFCRVSDDTWALGYISVAYSVSLSPTTLM